MSSTDLNNISAPSGDLSMNSFKITSLADATVGTDGLNLQTANVLYYGNLTPLNDITQAIADVSLNSYKITDLADAVLSTDALNQ